MRRLLPLGWLRPALAPALALALTAPVALTAAGSPAYAVSGASAPSSTTAAATAAGPTAGGDPTAAAEALLRRAIASPDTALRRQLFTHRKDLTAFGLARARALLARPTDGARDYYGDGYTRSARRTCTRDVCVHWVPTTVDAPPDRAWVRKVLRTVQKVYRTEVDRYGFRAPVRDGKAGGDGRFDVYLKDIGGRGAYGYCTPERSRRASATRSAGYCVLDNDFAAAQFGGTAPTLSLQVTAAHEFFHAVQFGYDVREAAWLEESTAVWMEEQVFGSVDDNRQFLPYGQLVLPAVPLDTFEPLGFAQYGNWVFFEHLSEQHGRGIVRRVWEQAARPGVSADEAVRRVLGRLKKGFPAAFAEYAAATTDAARTYREGAAWPTPGIAGSQQFEAPGRAMTWMPKVKHLASASYVALPGPTLAGGRLRITVQAARRGQPVVWLRVVAPDGSTTSRQLRLDKRARATRTVAFGTTQAASVTVTVANAALGGRARPFDVALTTVP